MRLVCPNCASHYEVDSSLFPEEGREVQCSSCEHVWVQYPVDEETPLRLDPGAVVTPPRPSERLDAEERSALARAVEDELAARGDEDPDDDDTTTNAPTSEDEDEIVAALRAQIAAEGGRFDDKGPAKSGRRDLRKAAEAVGVSVAEAADEAERKRKWDLEAHERERQRRAAASGRRDPLARAIQSYDTEPVRRRRGSVMAGLVTALVLVAAASAVYLYQNEIARAYPPAEPWLAQYDTAVEQARTEVEALYAEYSVVVKQQIAQLTGDGGE
ncbi:zinc-ribbon domain-containing protein [Halovulum marinum]|nr:zinc-ribbon domain-containing protein [Halovulum marinum]